MRGRFFATLLLVAAALGCGDGGTAGSGDEGTVDGNDAAGKRELLVGTWEYDLKYPGGDAVPCVRVLEEDGSGTQYAVEAGPEAGQEFTWELSDDARTLTLVYGGGTTVEYSIATLEGDTLVMTAGARNALPEECERRGDGPD